MCLFFKNFFFPFFSLRLLIPWIQTVTIPSKLTKAYKPKLVITTI